MHNLRNELHIYDISQYFPHTNVANLNKSSNPCQAATSWGVPKQLSSQGSVGNLRINMCQRFPNIETPKPWKMKVLSPKTMAKNKFCGFPWNIDDFFELFFVGGPDEGSFFGNIWRPLDRKDVTIMCLIFFGGWVTTDAQINRQKT